MAINSGVEMKAYHKSYLKTIILAAGCGAILASLAAIWAFFGKDMAISLGVPLILQASVVAPIALLVPAALCFAVAIGGLLSLYRDITRAGRP